MIRNERQTWKTNFRNTKLQRLNEGKRVMPAVRGHKLDYSQEEVEAHRWQAGQIVMRPCHRTRATSIDRRSP
jgi:hypothetical protein